MKHALTLGLILMLINGCQTADDSATNANTFPVSTIESERLDRAPIDRVLREATDGKYGNVDRIMLIKNGKLVVDSTFGNDYKVISKGQSSPFGCGYNTCEDSTYLGEYNYFHPRWHPYYKGRSVHTLQSISKSISSLLIGIAIDQGKIPNTNVPILEYFPDYDLSGVDDGLYDVTLEHLLKMTMGMEWYEIGAPETDSNNTTLALEKSDDWIRFTLAQPMDTLPDTKWVYNSGASQLMSVIISEVTGMSLDKYAEQYLFGPLEIENYHWKLSPKGLPDALGGVYLEAEDLAKIGQLVLNKGIWDGQEIVSAEWIERSTARLSDKTQIADFGYGYQWWRPDFDGVDVIAGFGFGGQALIIIPEYDMVAVTYCWNVFGEESEDIRFGITPTLIEAVAVQ